MKSRIKHIELCNKIINENREEIETQYLDIDINYDEGYIDLVIEDGSFSISTRKEFNMLIEALHKSFENLNRCD